MKFAEPIVYAVCFLSATVLRFTWNHVVSLPFEALCLWAGGSILATSFVRDIAYLAKHRKRVPRRLEGVPRFSIICVESTVGLLLVFLSCVLYATGTKQAFSLQIGTWLVLLSTWCWVFYFTRDFVLILRKEKDHQNILFW